MTIYNMIIPPSVEKKLNETKQNDIALDVKNRLAEEIAHRRELEDEKHVNACQSCCLTSDERALEFFLKSGVIFSVLVFSMIQVMTVGNPSERNAFLNVVILILGTFLPSPKIKEDKKK